VLRRLAPRTISGCCAPFRVVCVATGKTDGNGTPEVMVLVTNRLDLDARRSSRWRMVSVGPWSCFSGGEMCVGLPTPVESDANGVRMQVYVALIASLLISLWVGHAPTKRTYEMLCFYLSGGPVKRS